MTNRLRQIAENISNEIADQFVVGFYDGRMVEMHADLIEKHIQQVIDECIHEIDFYPIPTNNGGTPFEQMVHTLMYVKCNIKEHFGVK